MAFVSAPSADAPVQENGEANGEVKEPVDPLAPKKCDVIVLSGRKERCEAAVEALKVRLSAYISIVHRSSDLCVEVHFVKCLKKKIVI